MNRIQERKIVIVNQASNYLTIGLANAFSDRFEEVNLITGSVHVQGEHLNKIVAVTRINKFQESPTSKKMIAYLLACVKIYGLLVTKYRKHEVFFVSLPPMAYLLNIVVPHRFSMLIWDVYPDLFKITGMTDRHLVYRIWSRMNRASFKKAYRLFTIGDKMSELLMKYVQRDKIIIQPIWSIFQENNKVSKADNHFLKEHKLTNKFVVQYSGNIGLTHRVEVMVELAEKMRQYDHIIFLIIGRGSRVPALKRIVDEKKLPNCRFLPFQSDEIFPYSLSAADLGVVILDDLTSKGSVPSKSYNLMSFGIPSLYIASADSELYTYANKFGHGKCFSEKELNKAVDFILELSQSNVMQAEYSKKSLKASNNFKRENADKIVDYYIKNGVTKKSVFETSDSK